MALSLILLKRLGDLKSRHKTIIFVPSRVSTEKQQNNAFSSVQKTEGKQCFFECPKNTKTEK